MTTDFDVNPHLYDFEQIKKAVEEGLKSIFPIVQTKGIEPRTITLNGIEIRDRTDTGDIDKQYEALVSGSRQGWAVPVYADVTLRGAEGQIARKKVRIMDLPKITPRQTYIQNGKEYQLHSVLRRLAGVYTYQGKDNLISEFNFTDRGLKAGPKTPSLPFQLEFDDRKNNLLFRLGRRSQGQIQVPAFDVLRLLGHDPSKLKKDPYLGGEIWDINARRSSGDQTTLGSLKKLYRKLHGLKVGDKLPSEEVMKQSVRRAFEATELNSETTRITLGKAHSTVTPDTLVSSMQKLIRLSRREVEPDDRESLLFKSVITPPERLKEAFSHPRKVRSIQGRIKGRMRTKRKDKQDDLRYLLAPGVLNKDIRSILQGQEGTFSNWSNPIGMFNGGNKVSMVGTGGIRTEQGIPKDAPLLSPSHLAFLDPLATPECFDDQSEVFTSKGWKPWPEVNERDFLACRIEDRLEFHRPNRLIAEPYEGAMYGVSHFQFEYLVTPNHRVWFKPTYLSNEKWRFERADQVHELRASFLGEETIFAAKEGHYYKVHYSGMVYCAEVPGGLLLVRRNQKKCGIWSGNSRRAGVNLHFPIGVQYEDGNIRAKVITPKGDRTELITPQKAAVSTIAFPDEYDLSGKIPKPRKRKVLVQQGDEVKEVNPSEVDYIIPDARNVFTVSTNLIPFLANNQGNRAQMASKHATQALPLKYREAPLVQTGIEEKLAEPAGARFSPVTGEVTHVRTQDGAYHITIMDKEGEKHFVKAYRNFPLKKAVLDSLIKVQPGDKVKKGDLLADSSYTKDGVLAMGTTLDVAYMPYKSYNFEDSVLLSDKASKALTSEHLYEETMSLPRDKKEIVRNLDQFRTRYGHLIERPEYAAALDNNGVIKKGTRIEPGQTLAVALKKLHEKRQEDEVKLRRKLKLVSDYDPVVLTWDHDIPGVVTDVRINSDGSTRVFVKTEEELRVGDKIVGRNANKAIVSAILPEGDMPQKPDGSHVDILLSPMGVPGRINLGQVLETAAAKVARKTGKTITVTQFDPKKTIDQVKKILKDADIKSEDELIDPITGKSLGKVFNGPQYFYKLEHQVSRKASSRAAGTGRYDKWGVPSRGGDEGAQSLGELGTYALLGHGAVHNLRDAQLLKSQRFPNNELWEAIQNGKPLPVPKHIVPNERFEALMRVAGVQMTKGDTVSLLPQTDKDTKRMAGNRAPLRDPAKWLTFSKGRTTEVKEEPEGIFDPVKTGGKDGDRWSYFELPEPVPMMGYKEAIEAMTGWKFSAESSRQQRGQIRINKTRPGELEYKGKRAGEALLEKLKDVDLDDLKKKAKTEIESIKGSKQNARAKAQAMRKPYRMLQYIQHLEDNNLKPHEAYMMKYIPVLPPKLRPVTQVSGTERSADDMNFLYRNLALLSGQLQDAEKNHLSDKHKDFLRQTLWDANAAMLQMVREPPIKDLGGSFRGAIGTIAGIRPKDISQGKGEVGSPKGGLFQDQVVRRRQDFSARSTIIPKPDMDIDEVGLPFELAHEVFQPWAVREISRNYGMTLKDASDLYRDKGVDDDRVRQALINVSKERPVLLKRDPALHKYNIMAFRPRLTEGKAIQIHPLITGPYNADFDGDEMRNVLILNLPKGYKESDKYGRFSALRECTVTARFEASLPLHRDGFFAVCDLEDFPHGELVAKKDHIELYDVPDDIRVFAMDEVTGELCLSKVKYWSKHKSRPIEIVTLCSGKQIVTDDDERAVYGVDTSSLQWCRRRPCESQGQFVPVADELPIQRQEMTWSVRTKKKGWSSLKDSVRLDRKIGYFLGMMVGDGWVSKGGMFISSIHQEIAQQWYEGMGQCFRSEAPPRLSHIDLGPSDMPGSTGRESWSVHCKELAQQVAFLISTGSKNKHLPPFAFTSSKDFARGVLDGLWDSDGSVSWSKGKTKPQFMCSYTSRSLRLVQEIQLLLRSLGVTATITTTKTPSGKAFWMLNLSTVDLHRFGGFHLANPDKKEKMSRFLQGDPPDATMSYQQNRLVPVPSGLAKEMRTIIGSKERSLYATLTKAIKRQYVSEYTAHQLIEMIGNRCNNPLYTRWVELAQAEGYHFERVKAYERTEISEDGYDLTVPGSETFMSIDGVVLSNTMAVFAPVSAEAVDEAQRLMPSQNVFSVATGGLVYMPAHEAVLGLYRMTEVGDKTNKSFSTIDDARKALNKGSIKTTDQIKIGGRETTMGWENINGLLPREQRVNQPLSKRPTLGKKQIRELLTDLGKNNPQEFAGVINKLKDLGNEYATEQGMSFTLDDFDILEPKYRKDRFAQADKEAKRSGDIVGAYSKALVDIDKHNQSTLEQRKPGERNNIYDMVRSGARASWTQFKQIVSAPVLVKDPDDKIVPRPITSSFSEGLNLADYWTSLHGARKGAIAKSIGTSKPGFLSKQMVRTSLDQVINEEDCGTKQGVNLNTGDENIIGRYLASGLRVQKPGGRTRTYGQGTLITPDIASYLKANKVPSVRVRSPLRCESSSGVCARCYGLDAAGKTPELGTNVGVIAAQSIGEPSTQLSLRVFHCNHEDALVWAKPPNAGPLLLSLEQLWFYTDGIDVDIDTGEEACIPHSGWSIWDGKWVGLKQMTRHAPDRPISRVSAGGSMTLCQDNHPIRVFDNPVRCIECGYHRLKTSKKQRPHCPRCGLTQDPQEKKPGKPGFISPKEIEPKRVYLEHSWGPIDEVESAQPPELDPYLVGMYLAEGCIGWQPPGPGRPKKPYTVHFTQEDPELQEYILSLMPTDEPWRPKPNKRGIRLHSIELGMWFLEQFGPTSCKRALQPDFLGYPKEWLIDCLAGIIDGDGSIRHDNDGCSGIQVYSTSFLLLQQIQWICAQVGIPSSAGMQNGNTHTVHQCFQIRLRITDKAKQLLSRSLKVQRIEKMSPDQPVRSGHQIVTSVRHNVLYNRQYVYDVTTETGTLFVSGFRHHNSGGVVDDPRQVGETDRFREVEELFRLPKSIHGSAVLSPTSGEVKEVKPAPQGGWRVTIKNSEVHVPSDRADKLFKSVKPGAIVKRGDPLTSGVQHPVEVLKLRGGYKAQESLVNQLYERFREVAPLNKKHFEVVVKGMTDWTTVLDPKDTDWLEGQPVRLAEVKKENSTRSRKKKIQHSPMFKGIDQAPLVDEDWLARLNADHLRGTILRAIPEGWKSPSHGPHPIPPLTFLGEKSLSHRTGFGLPTPSQPGPY